jgi:spore germination cell wall hydrolase CwlJ-like protein
VPHAFARVGAFPLAAATAVFSVGAFFAAAPVVSHILGQTFSARPSVETRTVGLPTPGSRFSSAFATVAPAPLPAQPLVASQPSFSTAEALPAAGVVTTFRITEPHDGPALAFARQPAPQQLAYATFQRPAVMVAQLPAKRPAAEWPLRGAAPAETGPETAALAYAPAGRDIEAPFEALMGGADEGLPVPRPRPDDATLSAWLDGRAPGQFATGQHAWVSNPLPASVHDAKQQKCLAEGIYFEARGESELGQAAVAQVILNRVRNPAYPDTICQVVYQNKNWRNRCQFSFACDGVKDRVWSQSAWRIAQRIAKDVTDGKIWLDDVGDATHYHANYVRPHWGRRMIKTDRVGAHIFYRTRFGGWS